MLPFFRTSGHEHNNLLKLTGGDKEEGSAWKDKVVFAHHKCKCVYFIFIMIFIILFTRTGFSVNAFNSSLYSSVYNHMKYEYINIHDLV